MNYTGPDAVWDWFSLTYSSYLVMPRVLLCEMPAEWQERFVRCLQEYGETWDYPDTYYCQRRDAKGRYMDDPLRFYRHPDERLIDSYRRRRTAGYEIP